MDWKLLLGILFILAVIVTIWWMYKKSPEKTAKSYNYMFVEDSTPPVEPIRPAMEPSSTLNDL